MSILKGIKLLFRYHLGSVAFGSLLIVFTQFLQLILFTFEITKIGEQMNKYGKLRLKAHYPTAKIVH